MYILLLCKLMHKMHTFYHFNTFFLVIDIFTIIDFRLYFLRFEIVLTVEVEEDANFLSVDESSTLEVVKEKISDCVYDLDDVEILESDITRRID